MVTQAVYGLGGVGKSELALHHAVACRADYSLIWWITAEDGDADRRPGWRRWPRGCAARWPPRGPRRRRPAWAVGWLQAHPGWLLILDNVNDPADVGPLLGELTGGHIVITTRRDTGWDKIAVPVRLDVLDPGPAADLIAARTGSAEPAGRDAAAAIAAELGYLPLALDQAAAYITQTRITPAAYLRRLREHPAVMYAAGAGPGAADHRPGVGHHHRRDRRPPPGRDRRCCTSWPATPPTTSPASSWAGPVTRTGWPSMRRWACWPPTA